MKTIPNRIMWRKYGKTPNAIPIFRVKFIHLLGFNSDCIVRNS